MKISELWSKLKRNMSVIREQYQDWKREIRSLNARMSVAWEGRDWPEVFHISVGYLEETIDQMPRLWTYTWAPKWAAVAWLVCWALNQCPECPPCE